MDFLLHDGSSNKEITHLRLKSDLLQGTETMHKTFIKTQLLTLCAAYNLKCKKNTKNHDIIQKLKDKILESNSMPNPEILNVQKACEIETNITISTIENQEEQESELLREEIEIFEAMEEQFIQDDVEAGPSTRGDTQIPHSPVKVVGKGKRLAKKVVHQKGVILQRRKSHQKKQWRVIKQYRL